MKSLFFAPLMFLFFVFPLNAETNEKKEYSKYSFYSKCLDDALPRKINNGLVRLPLYPGLKKKEIFRIINEVKNFNLIKD